MIMSDLIIVTAMRQNEEAEFNKLNINKITSEIFSQIYSVLNLKFMEM